LFVAGRFIIREAIVKDLKVTISEYDWNVIPFPNADGRFILNCVDPRDGEVMFVIPDLVDTNLPDDSKKMLLNVFLTGFHKGARMGARKKAWEIRSALFLTD